MRKTDRVMNIQEIMAAKKALEAMGQYGGISRDQNRKMRELYISLDKAHKDFDEMQRKLFDEFAVDIPQQPYVPAQDYVDFKAELIALQVPGPIYMQVEEYREAMQKIFNKYEKKSNHAGEKGIPGDVVEIYRQKAEEKGTAFLSKIEFEHLQKDSVIEEVIGLLPGYLQDAIDFAFEESSRIIMPSGTITLQ